MEKKAAQKLFRRYCHELLFAAMRVILPAEGNPTVGEGYDSVVGNGNAMCVASQVMKDVQRTSEGRLGVHDPILAE